MNVTYPVLPLVIEVFSAPCAVGPLNARWMFKLEPPIGVIITFAAIPGYGFAATIAAPDIATWSWTFFHDTCSAESAATVKRMTGVRVAPRVAPADATVTVGFDL